MSLPQQKFGEHLANSSMLVGYFGALTALALKAYKDGQPANCNKYLSILARVFSLCFSQTEKHPELSSRFLMKQPNVLPYCHKLQTLLAYLFS